MNNLKSGGFKRRYYTKIMNWYRNSSIFIPLFNEVVRPTMRFKYLLDRNRVNIYASGREREMEQWFKETKFFFGLSSIRSGTVFLANMFKREVKDSHVEHEANIDDYWTYHNILQDSHEALKYFRDFRLKDMFFRSRKYPACKSYGEFNPMLRIHCRAIKTVLPQAKLFHIVRDGRDAIRSVMSRDIMGPKDPLGVLIHPPPGDPYGALWPQMSRFEKVCWQWQYDNRIMREAIPQLVQFELMMTDYDYFKQQLLDFLEVSISEETWQRYINQPRNVTRRHRMGRWTQWLPEQKAAFERICGDEMAEYGYQLS